MRLYTKKTIYTPYSYNEFVYNDILNICSPLFQSCAIRFFGYMRLFTNGQYFAVSSNLEWQKHFLEDLSHNHGEEFQQQIEFIPFKKTYYFLWPESPEYLRDQTLVDLHKYNLWNGLSIYRKEYNYIDSWSFAGSTRDSLLKNFYINHTSILNNFVNFFNQKFKPFLDTSDGSKLSKYLNFSITSILERNNSIVEEEKRLQNLLNRITLNHLYVTIDGKELYFSKREFECLVALSSGKTGKEIASLLNISPRTVECYINNIKLKTDIHYKSDLIKLYENIKKHII